MIFNLKSIVAVSIFAGIAAADYSCLTNLSRFTIKQAWAVSAYQAGGTTTGISGFPHAFGGGSGSGTTQLVFYGADPRCNEKNPKLFEFPIMKDGSKYNKDEKHGTTETPVRVVYLQDGTTLCGVMTHVIEDPKDHHGSGDFRVCDPI